MKQRLFGTAIVSLQSERDLDLADGENVHSKPCAQLFEKPIQNKEQWLQQLHWRIDVQVLFEVRGKLLSDQRVHFRALCQTPPAEPFLSQPLDNSDFGKGRKFRAGVNAPAFQGLDEFERDSESFERKTSDPRTFLSGRNHSHTGKTLRRANCGYRTSGDSNVG